jgi:hypothetical protein
MEQTINAFSIESNKMTLGELQGGKVRIETSMAILLSDTEVSIKTDDGSIVQARSMSSLAMSLFSPVEVFLEVADRSKSAKQKVIGGTLVMAEGDYKKGTGITILKGSDAKVLFNGTVYSGKIDEDVQLGMNAVGIRSESIGIKKVTN